MPDPILVLQLQRLGDIILTFPLLEDLNRQYPAHPILMAAEEKFYMGLEKLSPPAAYFPASRISELRNARFEMAINLSSRPEAAECLNFVHSGNKLGKIAGEALRINGYWQLYRANLTNNNRHNTFHWADLNSLDLSPNLPLIRNDRLPVPAENSRRVGLVIGASESSKRPDVAFWARLAVLLAKNGFMPFFLGGEAEKEAGREASRIAGLSQGDLCGRLSLPELAEVMKGLALCITPDTGPMHLASRLGTPVLNLSMGPVHAHETGPGRPGQWILRSSASCVGCWQCSRREFICKKAFLPHRVLQAANAILLGEKPDKMPGLELLRVARDESGLIRLLPQEVSLSARCLLENFWRHVFLAFKDGSRLAAAKTAAEEIKANCHDLAKKMRENLAEMLACTLKAVRGGNMPADFWLKQPLHTRLFAGHCQLWLENENFSRNALQEILTRQEVLLDLLC